MKDFTIKAVASGLGTGYAPIFPGTWGTLPGVLLAWLLFDWGWEVQVGLTLAALVIGVWSATRAESYYGIDNKKIVIDEIGGILVAYVLVPHVWQYYLIGFIIFRILDIWKPYPAANWEAFPGGWGTVADDFAVGVYTNVLLQMIALFGFWL
ncbi:MAG: phosphatidylglycerophosphatase A [candidate division Zixibacteria bacterium]|nr:phosphatidylglycerophosphatase A [candidate division Zixibacteria bacterium]